MGQRLTGWVAAHRQTIVNSDPMLDLGEVARALRPPLRSCLSTPLVAHDSLVGVLTLYSTYRDAFSEDHRRIVEVVARQVSETVQNAVDFRPDPNDNLSDPLTGLPNREDLDRFIASELTRGSRPCSILVLDIVQTSKGSIPTTWRVISKALTAARGGLRATDLVFRDEGDRFIVLLAQTEAAEADSLARQVASELSAGIFPDELARNLTAIRIGRATGPTDGSTLADLLRSAESRLVLRALPPRPSIH
jgi:diguanylate cyclase (GGDEF)-like protein